MVACGNISKNQSQSSSISYHSKDISELFPTASISSYFILIEGAPGIGKTVLSKEIAYQWAVKKLLKFKKFVFLLFLRDPNLQNMVILENLTQYLCNNNKRGSELSEYLLQTEGKDLTIIFDGYDEMSEEDRNNSLVAKIISRNVLPECDLVITSRPTASLHLRDMADCRVEVLGFTEEDRLDYVQQALKGSNDKIKVLQSYLQSNSTINALCYVPLNMTILLCLFEDINSSQNNTLNVESVKEVGLPNTQTEMYENFILMTITRCIKKSNKKFSGKYLKISELPEPYNEIFHELLQLAYYALTKDKIVFNSNEEIVQQVCKSLKSIYCEGLGLLKVTEYARNFSFHFLHFSIQEYLAAYYVTLQSNSFQVQLLRATFWEIRYFNTWIIYIGITGGKKIAWKHYISGNWFMLSTKLFKSYKISKSYLNDKIKSLHLFQCFSEIGGNKLVGEIFKDKIIDLSNQTLLPKHIITLGSFLLRSVNKHWIKLDISKCNIGGIGSDILCKTFLDRSREIVYIDKVNLSHNLLQNQSILELLDVLKFWHTSEAIIDEDSDDYDKLFDLCLNKFSMHSDEDFPQTVYAGPFLFAHNIPQQLVYKQLINSTNLTGLYLNYFSYQSVDSTFQELSHKLSQSLSKFHVIGGNLNIHFLGAVVQTMKAIDSVYIYDNTLSDEEVNYISSLIMYKTNTNIGIWVVIGSTKILGSLSNFLTLNKNFSATEIFNLAKSIRRLCFGSSVSTTNFSRCSHYESKSIFEDFLTLLHKSASKCDVTFCMAENNTLIANGVKYGDLSEALSLNDHLLSVYIQKCELIVNEVEAITGLISKQKSLKRLYIFKSLLDTYSFKEICGNLLSKAPQLREFLIHSTNSSCILAPDLLPAERNTSVLLITSETLIGQSPTSRQLALALQLEPNITVWKLPNCHINVQTFYQLAVKLSDVLELDISGCNLGECELQEIMLCTKQENYLTNLTKLTISNINITKQVAINMANLLSHANKLRNLDLSSNNNNDLLTVSVRKLDSLKLMVKLDLSLNSINTKTANDIALTLSQNTELKELNISSCNLQTKDAVTVFKGIRNLSHLTKLNISNNNISDEVADDIAILLFRNDSLEELDLSHNYIQATGAIKIFKKMIFILHLSKFKLSHNRITNKAADNLATILSQNVGLQELDLSYNYLQTTGAITVCKKMSLLASLTKLNISNNDISSEAASDIATVLSHNVGLQELDLSHNCLQATGISTVCKGMSGLTNLTKLNISNNSISGNSKAVHDIAVVLSQSRSLEELNLSYNNLGASCAENFFSSIKGLMSLIKLNADNIGMTDLASDGVVALLNNNVKLKELNLSHNSIQAVGAARIFKNTKLLNLNKLIITHNNITDQAADEIVTFISQNIELEELDLSHNDLKVAGAVKISRANNSNLKKLNISHNNITTEASQDMATFICHNSKLQMLDLCCNNLGFINIFRNMQTFNDLSVLRISNCHIISKAANYLANILLCNTKLIEIDLSYNDLSTSDTIKLFKGMKNISNLVAIDISHNMITDEAADDIATVLLHNTKLKELDLSHNNLSALGTVKIFKRIKDISNLVVLNISHNMITDEAANDISTVLSHNNNLQILNVSSSYLRFAGCVKILSRMKNMTCLTKLDISCNKLTIMSVDNNTKSEEYLCTNCKLFHTADTIKVFESLQNISNLRSINFANVMTTGVALDHIATFLAQNTELEEFDISSNNLKTADAILIFHKIKHISTFRRLNIAHNMITDGATECIATVLSNCTELVELNLSHNYLHNMNALYSITFSNLTKVNFSNNNINEQTLNNLGVFLSLCTKLEDLDLSNNNLQTAGSNKLFEVLNCITLKTINISGNSLTKDAADHIAIRLSRNKKLQDIDLSCNIMQQAGIRNILAKLQISNLTKLNISNNKCSDRNLVWHLLIHATNLVALDFSYNNICIIKDGQCCSNLLQLNMCKTKIAGEATATAFVLSENPKLQELNISCNNLHATDITNIFGKLSISHLTKFNVSNNIIGNQAADDIGRFLSQNTKLKELDVSCNCLYISGTKKLCRRIKNLSKLTKLKIGGNKFTCLAADDVAEILLHNTKLEEIDLSDNNFLGIGAISIFNAMKSIFTLRTINISHNQISTEAADSIAAILSQNTHLKEFCLADNHLGTNGIIALCKGMSNISYLTHLDMSSNKITDEAAHDIGTLLCINPELKELDLSDNLIQAAGATRIFKGMIAHSNLNKINICKNIITDEAADILAKVLSRNVRLQELDLSYNYLQTTGVITICKEMRLHTNLTKLNISNNNIGSEAVYDIAIVLSQNTSLEELDLSYNNLGASGSVKILINMNFKGLLKLNISSIGMTDYAAHYIVAVLNSSKIKQLDLSFNNFSAAGISKIFEKLNISLLTKLNVSYITIDEQAANCIGNFLSKNTKLKELDVSCNCLYISGTKKLCRRIKNLSKLTKLKIGGNKFTYLAADDVAEVLLHNTKLEEIDLSDNNFLGIGAISIFNAMKSTFTLRTINISHNQISTEAADSIAAILSQNTHLKELCLADNHLGTNGIITLCKGMRNISHLTHLDMSSNKVTDEAAHDIAALLLHNLELEVIDLSNNLIQATGATRIFNKIIGHSNLNKMSICKNAITDEAADSMAKFLSQSSKLKEFDVSYNCLQAVGAMKIFQAIKRSNLSKLNINNNMITDDGADDIIAALSKHTTLKELNI